MYDFFISHSSKDKTAIVEDLVSELNRMHFEVWYDAEKINFGDNINMEIDKGLRDSFCLALIVTKNFFESRWVYFEFGKYSAYQKARIVPIIYDISNEEYLQLLQILGNVKYINASGKSTKEIVGILAASLSSIKENNEFLKIKDEIYKLHRRIRSQEDIQSGLVCMALNDYFEISDSHQAYTVFTSKKVALEIVRDITRVLNINMGIPVNESGYTAYLQALNGKVSKNTFEYLKFIFQANDFISDKNYLTLINRSLLSVLQWYEKTKFPNARNAFSFQLLGPGEMRENDFWETDAIDYLVLREDLIASVETAIDWYEYNNYTYIAIRDNVTHKIVGYMTFLPITEDVYNQILSGDFMDKEFTRDSILQYEKPGLYTVYVASVAIHPTYQNTNAFYVLYNAAIDMFMELASQREIYVEKIIAEASTVQGEKLCKLMQMKKYCSTTTDTDVYTLTLIPPEFKLFGAKGKVFMNLCKQKYEEYREYFERT